MRAADISLAALEKAILGEKSSLHQIVDIL